MARLSPGNTSSTVVKLSSQRDFSREVLGARWSEIDLDRKIWAVPANRIKRW